MAWIPAAAILLMSLAPSFAQSPATVRADGTGLQAGNTNAWTITNPTGDTSPASALNDAGQDGNASYYSSNTTGQLLFAAVEDWSLPANNGITKVRVNVRAATTGNDQFDIGLSNNGTESLVGSAWSGATSGAFAPSTSPTFTDYWEEWSSPPGGTWAPNTLEVHASCTRVGGGDSVRVSEAWIEIYYQPNTVFLVYNGADQGGHALIQQAINACPDVSTTTDGVVVEIRNSATYSESLTIDTTQVVGTSAGKPFTLRAQTGQTPTIDNGTTALAVVTVSGVNFVTLQDLIVNRGNNNASGIIVTGTVSNTTLRRCQVRAGFQGILFDANATNGTVERCIVRGTGSDDGDASAEILTGCLVIQNAGFTVTQNTLIGGIAGLDLTPALWLNTANVTSGTIKNNIFYAGANNDTSFVFAQGQTFVTDFNDYYSFNMTNGFALETGGAGAISTLATLRTETGDDAGSINAEPLFVTNPTDLHLRSQFGTWNPGTSSYDLYADHSPCIDAGDPSSAYSTEPEDNGNRLDLGVYGNTADTSLSGVQVAGPNDDTITTWTGNAGTTNWATANNWSAFTPGASTRFVPGSTTQVYVVDRSFDPVLSSAGGTIATLLVSSASNNSPAVNSAALTISGAGSLTVSGSLTIAGGTSLTHSAGTIQVGGNLVNSGTLSDSGGLWEFNGTGNQTITAGGATLAALRIVNSGGGGTSVATSGAALTVSGTLTLSDATLVNVSAAALTASAISSDGPMDSLSGTFTCTGALTVSGTGNLNLGSATVNVAGDLTNSGTLAGGTSTLALNGSGDQTISPAGASLNIVTVSNTSSSATVSVTSALVTAGAFTLTGANSSTVTLQNGTHASSGAVVVSGGVLKLSPTAASTYTPSLGITVASGAGLRLQGPSTLRLPSAGLTINGDLYALADTGRPKITTTGTEGGAAAGDHYALNFSPSTTADTIDIYGLDVASPDTNGLRVNGTGASVVRIDDVRFSAGNYGSQAPDAYTNAYLNLVGVTSGSYTFRLNDFDQNCKYNVKLGSGDPPPDGFSTANITMENSGGAKGDADGSDTPGGGGNAWTGEGRDGDPDGDVHCTWKYFKKWIGGTNTLWSLGANWEGGSAPSTTAPYDDVLIVPGIPYNPTLDSDPTINNLTIDTSGALSLGARTLTIQGDNFQTFGGTLNPGTGTIVFGGSANQIVNVGINPMYNIQVNKPGGTVNLAANLAIRNDFTLVDGTVDLKGYAMTVGDAAYGVSMACALDSDNDGDGTVAMGTTSSLTTRRATTTNKTTLTMSGTASWSVDDGSGANNATLTLGPSSGNGGSLTLTDRAKLVVGDADGSDTLTTQGGATVLMNASSFGVPRLELATGASATFNADFRTSVYQSTKPVVTRRTGDAGTFTFTLNAGVDIRGLAFSYGGGNGLDIATAAATITNLNYVDFTNGSGGGRHLRMVRAGGGNQIFEGLTFDATATFNARLEGAFTAFMSNSSGALGGTTSGEANDEDGISGSVITWVDLKTWAGRHEYKQQLTVGSTPLANEVIEITYTGATTPTAAQIRSRCGSDSNNFRTYYNAGGGSTWTEIGREVRSWTDGSVVVRCALQANGGASTTDYWVGYGSTSSGTAPTYNSILFTDDFETDLGWSRDAASNSADQPWQRGDPTIETTSIEIQPENDNTASPGTLCWCTGPDSDTTFSFNASEILLSPTINLSSAVSPRISYYRYYAEAGDNGNQWLAEHTSSGNPNNTIETITTNANAWALVTSVIPSPHATSSTYRLRVTVSKNNAGATSPLIEINGLIDDVLITNRIIAATLGSDTSISTGLWSEPLHWSPPGVPASNNAVLVNAGYTIAPDIDAGAGFGGTILSLELRNTSPAAVVMTRPSLTITRDLTFGVAGGATTGSISNVNGQTINVGGNWTLYTGSNFTAGTGTVLFNGGISQSVGGTAATAFNNLQTSGAGTTLAFSASGSAAGATSIGASSTLRVGSGSTLTQSGTSVTVNGTLDIEANATLSLAGGGSATTLTVTGAGSALEIVGTDSNQLARVTSSDTTKSNQGYSVIIAPSGTIRARYYKFEWMGTNGIDVGGAVDANPNDMRDGYFDNLRNFNAGGATFSCLLSFVNRTAGALTLRQVDFRDSAAATGAWGTNKFNVRGSSTAGNAVTINQPTGAAAGEDKDQDSASVVTWPTLVVPRVRGAVADDNSGAGAGIQFGDRVVLTFFDTVSGNGASTNAYNVLSGGPNTILPLNNGHVWGSVVSTSWGNTYTAGTVAVTNGSTSVNGTGTTWLASALPGESFQVAGDPSSYTIATVDSETSLTLSAAYTGATASGQTYTVTGDANTRLLVTLGSGATVSVGDTIANGANFGGAPPSTIMDATETNIGQGTNSGAGTSAAITGSFGADEPDMTSALAAEAGAFEIGPGAGDTVALTFSAPTNAYTVTGGNINTALRLNSGAHTWGGLTSAVWNGTVTTVSTDYTGGGTLSVASTAGFPASVSTPVTVFVNGDDFTYTAIAGNDFTGVSGLGNHTANERAYRNNNTVLTITLDGTGGPTIAPGDTITINSSTIMDTQHANTASGSPPSLTGNFGATTVDLTSATADDTSGGGVGIQDGDRLILQFDNPTNGYTISQANIAATLVVHSPAHAVRAWGDITSAFWTDSFKTLTITFAGTGGTTVADGDHLFVTAGTIKDASGTNNATPTADPGRTLSGSFGSPITPKILSIVADDTSGGGAGVQAGDRVILTFDAPTNAFTNAGGWGASPSTIDGAATGLPLGGGRSWRDGTNLIASATWSNGNTILTITLSTAGGTPTVVVGENVSLPVNTIEAPSGGADATGFPLPITGSFGAKATYSGTVYANDDDTGPIAGVTVRLVIDGTPIEAVTSNGSGGFSLKADTDPGDRVLVYLDTNGGTQGTTVTVAPGNNISGINIYQNRVAIRNDNGGATTDSDLAAADSGDSDIRYAVSGVNLTLDSGHTLYVRGNFTPGGNITTQGTGGLKVGAGTFTHGDFTHTIAGMFAVAGGTVVLDAGDLLDANGGVTLTAGAFNPSGGEIRVAGTAGLAWDDSTASGGFVPTGGTVTFDAAAGGPFGILQRTSATRNRFWNVTVSGAAGVVYELRENGTTVTYPSGAGNGFLVGGALTVSGGTLDLEDNDSAGDNPFVEVDGAVTVNSTASATLDGTGNTSTLRVGGNWTVDGTYSTGTMTVGFDGAPTQTIASAGGTNTFYDINVGIDAANTTASLGNNTTVTSSSPGDIVSEGILSVNGAILTLQGASVYTVLSGGTLRLDAGSTLRFTNAGATTGLTINSGGALATSGTSLASRATLQNTGGGSYSISVAGTMNTNYLTIQNLGANGIDVTATAILRGWAGMWFDSSAGGAGSRYIDFTNATGATDLDFDASPATPPSVSGCRFDAGPQYNVQGDGAAATHPNVSFVNWGGALGGEANENNDQLDLVDWDSGAGVMLNPGGGEERYASITDAILAASANGASVDTIEVRDNVIREEVIDLTALGANAKNIILDGAVLRVPNGATNPAIIGSGDNAAGEVLRNLVLVRATGGFQPILRNVGRVFHCSIVGDRADGVLVDVTGGNSCTMQSCVVGDPSGAGGWGAGAWTPVTNAGTFAATYTDFDVTAAQLAAAPFAGLGNFRLDPLFQTYDPASGMYDLHLRPTSPCIDYAPAPPVAVDTDFDRGQDFENPAANPRRPVDARPNSGEGGPYPTWDDDSGLYDVGADELAPFVVGTGNRSQGTPLWANRAGTGVVADPDSFSIPITSFTFSPAVMYLGENNNVSQGVGRDVRLVAYSMNDADSNGVLDTIDSLDLTGAGIQMIHSITVIGAGAQDNLYLVVDTNGDADTIADAILAVSYTPSAAPNELALRGDWGTNPVSPAGTGGIGRIVIDQSSGNGILYFARGDGQLYRRNATNGTAPAASGNWLASGRLNLAGYGGKLDAEGSLFAGKFNNSIYAPTNQHANEIVRIEASTGALAAAKNCGAGDRNHFGFNMMSQSVFVTGADQFVWRIHEDTLDFDLDALAWTYQSAGLGAGVRTSTRAQTFRTVDANVRVGAGPWMYKLRRETGALTSDSDAAGDDWGPGRTFRGNIMTAPTLIGGTGKDYTGAADGRRCGKVVFGTDQGYCYVASYIRATLAGDAEDNGDTQLASTFAPYVLNIADGRPYPGFPYRIPGVKIVNISLLTSSTVGRQVIVFITDNGWAYGFIEPY